MAGHTTRPWPMTTMSTAFLMRATSSSRNPCGVVIGATSQSMLSQVPESVLM